MPEGRNTCRMPVIFSASSRIFGPVRSWEILSRITRIRTSNTYSAKLKFSVESQMRAYPMPLVTRHTTTCWQGNGSLECNRNVPLTDILFSSALLELAKKFAENWKENSIWIRRTTSEIDSFLSTLVSNERGDAPGCKVSPGGDGYRVECKRRQDVLDIFAIIKPNTISLIIQIITFVAEKQLSHWLKK